VLPAIWPTRCLARALVQLEWGSSLAAVGASRHLEAAMHLRVAATLFLHHHTAPAGKQGRRYTGLDGERALDRRSAVEVGWRGEGGRCMLQPAPAGEGVPARPGGGSASSAVSSQPRLGAQVPRPLAPQAALKALDRSLALQMPAGQQCDLRVAQCEAKAHMYALLAGEVRAGGLAKEEAELWRGRVQLCLLALTQGQQCAEQAKALLPLVQQMRSQGH
jgi:hypothetical protein